MPTRARHQPHRREDRDLHLDGSRGKRRPATRSIGWRRPTRSSTPPSATAGGTCTWSMPKRASIKNQITKGEYVVRGIDRIDEEKRQIWFRASGKNAGPGPVLHPLLSRQLRRHGPGRAHRRRRQPLGPVLARPQVPDRHLQPRRHAARARAAARVRRQARLPARRSRHQRAEAQAAGSRSKSSSPRAATARPTSGASSAGRAISIPTRSIRSSSPSTPARRARSCPSRFAAANQLLRRSPTWASSSCRSTAWARPTAPRRFTTSAGRTSRTPASPTASCGSRRPRRSIRTMDLSRVGIYGGSAGGQNAAGAVLFHPDFYKVGRRRAAAATTIAWTRPRGTNSGWAIPVGPQYAECSNIDNAHRLQGKLLLIVGEMDTNVPPESTMRLADALIKAGKDFDLLVVPGGGHGMGGEYGARRMRTSSSATCRASSRHNRNAERSSPRRPRTAMNASRTKALRATSPRRPSRSSRRSARRTATPPGSSTRSTSTSRACRSWPSAEVADEALQRTHDIVTHMLAGRPDILEAMAKNGTRLIIIGKDQVYTDMPEYRNHPNPAYQNERVRGTGGLGVTSFGEENLLNLPLDRYDDESIARPRVLPHHRRRPALASTRPGASGWQRRYRNAIGQGPVEERLRRRPTRASTGPRSASPTSTATASTTGTTARSARASSSSSTTPKATNWSARPST